MEGRGMVGKKEKDKERWKRGERVMLNVRSEEERKIRKKEEGGKGRTEEKGKAGEGIQEEKLKEERKQR